MRSNSGAPNFLRARRTRPAFSAPGRIQISRSPVARGCPCAASAWAPTIMNSAPVSDSAHNISTKSRFIDPPFLEHPGLQGERPYHHDALLRGKMLHIRHGALVLEHDFSDAIMRTIHRRFAESARTISHYSALNPFAQCKGAEGGNSHGPHTGVPVHRYLGSIPIGSVARDILQPK